MLLGEPLGHIVEAGDHEVQAARVKGFDQIGRDLADLEPRLWRHRAHPGHDRRDQDRTGIGAGRDGEASFRARRIEVGRRDGRLQGGQRRMQPRSDLDGARRRSHAMGIAPEELIAQGIAQAVERMADGRLAQAQPGSGPGDTLLFQEGVEHPEQIEVDRPDMHGHHSPFDDCSFPSCSSAAYAQPQSARFVG